MFRLINSSLLGFIVFVLNGCGGGGGAEDTSGSPSSSSSEVIAVAGNREVTIAWDRVSDADGYHLYYATESGVTPENYAIYQDGAWLRSVTPPHKISGLSNGVKYYFVVTAYNENGESSLSAPLAARPFEPVQGKGQTLNDTGINWCANGSTNNLACPVSGYSGQDGESGRDARARAGTLRRKSGSGAAGFDFTKLDANGNGLPANAAEWSCVKDNHTGLTWEVKTTDGGLQDKDNTYTWFNADSTTNGGSTGVQNGGSCTVSECDTSGYERAINGRQLCGSDGWRMPTRKELLNILHNGRTDPAIDESYFRTEPLVNYVFVWSSSPYVSDSSKAWIVNFDNGRVITRTKTAKHRVRLVLRDRSVPKKSLTIIKAGTGAGIVVSEPSGINCGNSCVAEFDEGTSVSLTASPANDAIFDGWSGACSGSGSTCTVSLSEARSVTATFNSDDAEPSLSFPNDFVNGADGQTAWDSDTSTFYSGGSSISSGSISHSEIASMELTGDFDSGALSFSYKVSSEQDFDYFRFYINAEEQLRASGSVDWIEFDTALEAGVQTLRWEYSKDGSVSAGSDKAWVDTIQLPAFQQASPDAPGNLIAGRYLPVEDGAVIRDRETGLEWQRCAIGQTWSSRFSTCYGDKFQTYSWDEAIALTAPGGFRIPTIEELRTLVFCSNTGKIGMQENETTCSSDGTHESPTIVQEAFPNSPTNYHWSGSPFTSNGAWGVAFFNGFVGPSDRNVYRNVRLVRAGQ